MRFRLHYLLFGLATIVGVFVLFSWYSILANNGGGDKRLGLLAMSAVVLTALGIASAVWEKRSLKPGPNLSHQPVPKEHKLAAAGILLMAVGATVAVATNLPIIFGYTGGIGLVLILFSFRSRRNLQSSNSPASSWFNGVRIIILVIPILFVLLLVYFILSGHLFDGLQY